MAALVFAAPGMAANKKARPAFEGPKLGRPMTPEQIARVDLTVTPDGDNLPAGSGSVGSPGTELEFAL